MRRVAMLFAVLAAAVPACGGGNGDLSGDVSFCELARRYEPALDDALSGADTETLSQEVRATSDVLTELRKRAPEPIEDDVGVVVDGFLGYLAAIERAGFDGARVPPETLGGLDAPAFTAASRRVADYNRDVCGLTPGQAS